MSFVLFYMIQVVIIVLITNLTVSVIAVRHRLWYVVVVLPQDIHIRFELPS